jgi:peptide/nickel transport system permease protein
MINIIPTSAFFHGGGSKQFFKKFGIGKPLFLNFSFLVNEEDIEKKLILILRTNNPQEKYRLATEIIKKGTYTFPALLKIIKKIKEPKMEKLIKLIVEKISEKKVENSRKELILELKRGIIHLSLSQRIKILFTDTAFFHYLTNIFNFDFGKSIKDNRPVLPKIMERLKITLPLLIISIIFSFILSMIIGVISAYYSDSIFDQLVKYIQFALYSFPIFFISTLLLQYFSKGGNFIHIFPTGGLYCDNFREFTIYEKLKDISFHLVLPIISLSLPLISTFTRYIRDETGEVMKREYIKAARARGIPEWVILWKHGMMNGVLPILTVVGSVLPILVGGSVIVEYIYDIPGIGLLIIDSIKSRDYNMIMAIQIIGTLMIMITIFISDLIYGLMNPKIYLREQ